MLLGIFLIIKLLVGKILLNPKGSGIFPENFINKVLINNCKLLASLVFYSFMEFVD